MSRAARRSSAPSSHPSEQLFARARLGDASALGQLIARYLPRLHRWAHGRLHRGARSRVDTGDIVQDAAIRTIDRAGLIEVRDEQALMAYLRLTVANRIRDEHRTLARHPTSALHADSLVDGRPSPLDGAISSDLEAKYLAALARLRPQDRELVVAHIELGFSHNQLGYLIGKTPNAARMALERALEQLAGSMRNE